MCNENERYMCSNRTIINHPSLPPSVPIHRLTHPTREHPNNIVAFILQLDSPAFLFYTLPNRSLTHTHARTHAYTPINDRCLPVIDLVTVSIVGTFLVSRSGRAHCDCCAPCVGGQMGVCPTGATGRVFQRTDQRDSYSVGAE